ncbi:hypothetical protein CDL15_Pgr004091 [Punica granatum]|uniref:Uncharacterized protein n=1 Tax=Punica granatum TaxID=22663 RepID=A0A218XH45_PUNGR|nr:hypothetical protein CDL15_Pgr004091 [Punica granatum]
MDTKSWTRSPKSGKDGREVRKAVEMDTKSRKAVKCSGRRGLHCRRGGCALLEAHFAPRAVVRLIRQKPTLRWIDCLLLLLAAGLAAEAIACWECPGLAYGIFACEAVARCLFGGCLFARDRRLAMRDSSSESAYVPSWTGDQSLP